MMRLCDKEHAATQYALISALFSLSRHLAGAASGFAASRFGYAPFFAYTFLLAIPGLVLVPFLRRRLGGELKRAMRHVLGIDAGGTKTRALLADGGRPGRRGGLGRRREPPHARRARVEKVLHAVAERDVAPPPACGRTPSRSASPARAGRTTRRVLREILRRIGFRDRVVVTNDAHIAFVAGSPRRVGLALVCGTGSIAWGQNAGGEIARAGGFGWHVGDEGSGFWIGERAIRAGPARARRPRAGDGARGGAPRAFRDRGSRGHRARRSTTATFRGIAVALFAVPVAEAARAGDAVAAQDPRATRRRSSSSRRRR